ncbi:hypothetical protein TGAM01_v205214 [Trichoderma gamsii]|uniref:Uncharacterized protein n=1 Tax=Trichoderma gamsii TaxID=398673 RepID=A0A2P4ZNB0_9HYPO|nr:hypothetical protein TGAM01_v205214 [Trichoderma gamsii]PON25777.1 hypothetical protein TGAM01_v205214 [Trichoderma gamsii]
MDDQISPDGRLSRDSSISLEDHNGPAPRLSRSDLYTAHQVQRDAYYRANPYSLFMIPLDFPATYNADEIPTGVGPSDAVDETLLSSRRLEQYLSEERRGERIALGMQPLGVNRATVQHYLPEIIQSMDNNVSQAEATVGTMEPEVEPEEGVCWGSFTTLASTTSDGSSGPVTACKNKSDDGYIAEAANSGPFPATPSSDQHSSPGPTRLGKPYVAPIQSQHALASNESNLVAQDTAECDLELEDVASNFYKTISHRRRGGYQVENQTRVRQARVKKTARLVRRSEKQQKETKK